MADLDIDFERVITDPIYRRKVIEQLKTEANEGVRNADTLSDQLLRKNPPCSAA